LQKPLIAIIDGPTTFALFYVVFIVGAWMSRSPHYLDTLV
jgi:hypothetical protein